MVRSISTRIRFALNTELRIIIDSQEIAREMCEAFDDAIAPSTYRVVFDEGGRLGWVDKCYDEPEVELIEPGTTWWSRLFVRALSWLPLERLL